MKTKKNLVSSKADVPSHQSGDNERQVICTRAFHGCCCLKNLQLPDGIEEIGVDAFRESGLENIETPKSVKIIR